MKRILALSFMLLGNRGFAQEKPATPGETPALKAKVSASSEFSATYLAILKTFGPIRQIMKEQARDDKP